MRATTVALIGGCLAFLATIGSHHQQVEARSAALNSPKKLVCYYDSWASERPGKGRLTADKLDASLCTHLIYNYATIGDNEDIKMSHPKIDLDAGMMRKFNALKRSNPRLKTLISINDGSTNYNRMTTDPKLRSKFAKNLVNFVTANNFDGAEISWKHPNDPKGLPEDKPNYVLLLKELKPLFEDKDLLLAASVAVGKLRVETGYDIGEMGKYLDLMNVGSIDYNGNWDKETGPTGPLYGSSKYDLDEKDAVLNVNHSINYLLSLGAPPEKMMLGIAMYGRTWTLERTTANGFNAPTAKMAAKGPYVKSERLWGYNELCEAFKNEPESWTIRRDAEYQIPYAVKDKFWVSYEDMDSVTDKAHFATKMKLGGVAVLPIDNDDFSGTCHDEAFPLVNSIKSALLDVVQ